MFGSIFSGEAEGVAGIGIPGICMFGSIFSGEAEGIAGIDIPGMRMPGMLLMSCFLAERFRRAIGFLRRDRAFRFTFALACDLPGIFMPAML